MNTCVRKLNENFDVSNDNFKIAVFLNLIKYEKSKSDVFLSEIEKVDYVADNFLNKLENNMRNFDFDEKSAREIVKA